MATVNPLLVAAIEFGITNSGWAFSFRHEFDNDPTKVTTKLWIRGNLMSLKAPTCALVEPDGKSLAAFGYEAKDRYSYLAVDGKQHQWYYFKEFVKILHGKIVLQRNSMLDDITGKRLPALDVFSLVIKYLKDDVLTDVKRRLSINLLDDEMLWVLTLPAICNDAAKQFITDAARMAGIANNRLTVALEPEAAYMFCRHEHAEKMVGLDGMLFTKLISDSKFIMLDAGAKTVDITVYEMSKSNGLQELYTVSENCGGNDVSRAYEQFLVSLVGCETWGQFKRNFRDEYTDMLREFEVKQRTIQLVDSEDSKVTFVLTPGLLETYQQETGLDLKNHMPKHYYGQVSFLSNKVRVSAKLAKGFFKDAINNTMARLLKIMMEPKVHGVQTIVMIGGFSGSKLLQSSVRKEFPSIKVVIPEEADEAILKGAVILGHCK